LKDGVRLVEVNELFRRYEQNTDSKKPAFWKYLEENYRKFYDQLIDSFIVNYKNTREEENKNSSEEQSKKESPEWFRLWDWLLFFWDINQTQLNIALAYQKQYFEVKKQKISLWKILIAHKYISKERLAEVGTLLGFMKLWEYLVFKNYVSLEQMRESIQESKKANKLLWMILIEKW
jgi:hypothetical protein